jgi:hypothetical protein
VLPVSVQVKFATGGVTVRFSVGVAWVRVPSVPWIVKLNVPTAALPNVTVKGAPAAVGVIGVGVVHVAGAPTVQDTVTLPE